MSKVIGVAAGRKYAQYESWLAQSGVEVFRLSYELANLEDVSRCDGVVMAGGEDVHPKRYHRPELMAEYRLDDIDERRDEFEWQVLTRTQAGRIPLLGICRGLQLVNVFFGGTLVPDIVSFGKPDHTRLSSKEDRHHSVILKENTLLQRMAGVKSGEVNSSHHQSADSIGTGLMVNAVSPDGIIEGLERVNKENLSFLMLVQWHPERMKEKESPLSKNLRNHFIASLN